MSPRMDEKQFQETLAEFGNAVRAWSEGEMAAPAGELPRPGTSRFRFPLIRLGWAAAAIALVLTVWVSIGGRRSHSNRTDSAADAALLQRVNTELSRSVPEPMEPLTRLVSWDRSAQ